MRNIIQEATRNRCLYWQERVEAAHAMSWWKCSGRNRSWWQEEAAKAHENMRTRLERLIGVDAIEEVRR